MTEEHITEPARDYAAGATLAFTPAIKSRCTIGGPGAIVIQLPTPAPNLFWRTMQRWCLGIVWEVVDE